MDLQVRPSYLLNLIGSNSSESNLLGNKNVLQIQGEPLLAFHIRHGLVFNMRQMSSSAMQDTTIMQMQAPYMWPQQTKGIWLHSPP